MTQTTFDSITVDENKCTGCGLCVGDCPTGRLYLENRKAKVRDSFCIECGHCYAICPTGAARIRSYPFPEERVASTSDINIEALLRFMKSRRSVRQFTNDPIELKELDDILEAGRYAPTATNAQDVSYILLGSRQEELERECVRIFRFWKRIIAPFVKIVRNIEITDDFFFKGAPIVIVVTSKVSINAALASSYMELAAESKGIGVLYCGFFVFCTRISRKIRKILALDRGEKVVSCLVLGKSNVKYHRIPPRKVISVKTL